MGDKWQMNQLEAAVVMKNEIKYLGSLFKK